MPDGDFMIPGVDGSQLVVDFLSIASIAGLKLGAQDVTVEELPAPYRPPSRLPDGKMAVYAFFMRGECLKVGKAGPQSQARYVSQHYSPRSSMSNLARSILKDKNGLGVEELKQEKVGDWIKQYTDRMNLLLPRELGVPVLTLLEAFLQCRLRPRFEGFESQRQPEHFGLMPSFLTGGRRVL
jgi:hypothetical protein